MQPGQTRFTYFVSKIPLKKSTTPYNLATAVNLTKNSRACTCYNPYVKIALNKYTYATFDSHL